jgi:hypothetical protein
MATFRLHRHIHPPPDAGDRYWNLTVSLCIDTIAVNHSQRQRASPRALRSIWTKIKSEINHDIAPICFFDIGFRDGVRRRLAGLGRFQTQ